ncbi:MAG TPA: hypothetical protein PL009_05060 [Flavipsychrobacter sp.]|nr:hypothetical protein [Flavipsychrobacter sp.]
MAENRNQNPEQNRAGQQSGNLGSSQERGNQSTQRQGLDEDLQQEVSTGKSQSDRTQQGSQENLDSETRSGQQESSRRGMDSSEGSASSNR